MLWKWALLHNASRGLSSIMSTKVHPGSWRWSWKEDSNVIIRILVLVRSPHFITDPIIYQSCSTFCVHLQLTHLELLLHITRHVPIFVIMLIGPITIIDIWNEFDIQNEFHRKFVYSNNSHKCFKIFLLK